MLQFRIFLILLVNIKITIFQYVKKSIFFLYLFSTKVYYNNYYKRYTEYKTVLICLYYIKKFLSFQAFVGLK